MCTFEYPLVWTPCATWPFSPFLSDGGLRYSLCTLSVGAKLLMDHVASAPAQLGHSWTTFLFAVVTGIEISVGISRGFASEYVDIRDEAKEAGAKLGLKREIFTWRNRICQQPDGDKWSPSNAKPSDKWVSSGFVSIVLSISSTEHASFEEFWGWSDSVHVPLKARSLRLCLRDDRRFAEGA